MNILALETSTHQSSIALALNGEVHLRMGPSGRGQTQWLLPEIDNLLKAHGLKVSDLDGLVYSEGPGSFTGLRAGVSVIQAFAFAHDIAVVSINSLKAYALSAYEQYGDNEFAVCVDAKMGEVFYASYAVSESGLIEQQAAQILKPELLLETIVLNNQYALGDGWQLEPLNQINIQQQDSELFPTADILIKAAIPEFKAGNTQLAEQVMPVYLRDKTAWKTVAEQG